MLQGWGLSDEENQKDGAQNNQKREGLLTELDEEDLLVELVEPPAVLVTSLPTIDT